MKREGEHALKTVDVVGANYSGAWTKTRTACRCVIVKDGRILLSHETLTDLYMIPGGGREEGESDEACCIREVAEETGLLVKPSECVLQLDEYYEDAKYSSRYFFGEIAGTAEMHLTDHEKDVRMGPEWHPLDEALRIFSRHADYAAVDEGKRGLYLREYTALTEVLEQCRR